MSASRSSPTVDLRQIAADLFTAAVDKRREPRSPAYKAGLRAALYARAAGGSADCPYPPGTAEFDAWTAGADEGWSLWRGYIRAERESAAAAEGRDTRMGSLAAGGLGPKRRLPSAAGFECPACHAVSHHPDDARARYCGACHIFWTRLGPGVYSGGGEIHMSLLALRGIPNTPANQRDLIDALRRQSAKDWPGVPVVECGTGVTLIVGPAVAQELDR